MSPIEVFVDSTDNDVDYNNWVTIYNWWKWNDTWRSDFVESYKSVTGWDANGTIIVE